MKRVLGGLFLFILGIAVGITGSNDPLLDQARQREAVAFGRGHAAATAEMQAMAVQTGSARWVMNPHTGQADWFIWKTAERQDDDFPDNVADDLRFFAEPHREARRPDGV